MKMLVHDAKGFEKDMTRLLERRALPEAAEAAARRIIDEVRRKGDAALTRLALEIDKVKLSPSRFRVGIDELKAAASKTSPASRQAIKMAISHISVFAKRQVPQGWTFSPASRRDAWREVLTARPRGSLHPRRHSPVSPPPCCTRSRSPRRPGSRRS